MTPSKHPKILQRKTFFIACEGQSEHGYLARLRQVLQEENLDVSLCIENLRGGDALTLLKACCKKITDLRRTREPFISHSLLLDSDMRTRDMKKDSVALTYANKHQIRLIWQNPCHEALLLRHFEGNEQAKPKSTKAAIKELRKVFPSYEKGLSAQRLKVIGLDEFRRAAKVEPDLLIFFQQFGLI